PDLGDADGVKIPVAISLNIRWTDSRIAHNSGATSRFYSGGAGPVRITGIVKGMGSAKLMSHLMRNIVNSKGITHGGLETRHTSGFIRRTYRGNLCYAVSAVRRSRKNMTDVVIVEAH